MSQEAALNVDPIEGILLQGRIELQGQFVLGYNYTFLVRVTSGEDSLQAVYKPRQGEQPLWDFPENSLAQREVAAYLVSQALGWELVPVTVLREAGPFGPGSLQQYVEHDPEYHYFTFSPEDRQRLQPAAVFDALVNNADRKGGHILVAEDRSLRLIDHGLCFHEEEKLRSVIWDFAGQTIPADLLKDLGQFQAALNETDEWRQRLALHLSEAELLALQERCRRLLEGRMFPLPPADRRAFPYPPI